jgi:SAM-dependent methyltransferase
MIMERNQEAYLLNNVVKKYTAYNSLQKGEISIFKKFKDKIKLGKVLDVGIGGGRTTFFLSQLAKEYFGIDFSQIFVDYCNEKYSNKDNVTIQYGDARNLETFKSADFDFIFFSFNGIDCVDFEGRKKILSEFERLLKSDGVLCFSFHNKNNLDKLYSFQFPRNPFKYIWEWKRMRLVTKLNGNKEKYRNMDWFILKDGADDFQVECVYIDALFQKKCLKELGFNTFYFYDSITGKEVSILDLNTCNSPWIYISAQR